MNISDKIKHVVVLMLENRSTDHILGDFPGVNGIENASYNLIDPSSPYSWASNPPFQPYGVDVNSQPSFDFTPDHSFQGMMLDLFGPGTIGCVTDPGALEPAPIPAPGPCYPTQTNCGFLHPLAAAVTSATNASPIVIKTDAILPLVGATVAITGVQGNTAANNTTENPAWTVNSATSSGFSLGNSTGNAAYTSGGEWVPCSWPDAATITNATSANPIVISTVKSAPPTGTQVFIAGVKGNTAANGSSTVTNNSFSLNDSVGNPNQPYTSGGVWFAGSAIKSATTSGGPNPSIVFSSYDSAPPTSTSVYVAGVNTAANGGWASVTSTGEDTFEVDNPGGTWTPYTSGGVWAVAQPIEDVAPGNPIAITIPSGSTPPPNGTQVIVDGVQGLPAANGTWTVASAGASGFSLAGSDIPGGGSYTSGTGVWLPVSGIAGATTGTPIVITVPTGSAPPPAETKVYVAGVNGNLAANGAWTSLSMFSLNGSQGNETYTSGGSWYVTPNPIMSHFNYHPDPGDPRRLKVLHYLAEQFHVCDNWFCDVPANTIPNRMFMHAATSQGQLSFDAPSQGCFNARSIYEQLSWNDQSWAVYYYAPQDQCDSIWFKEIAHLPQAQRPIGSFAADVEAGNLPFYTFLMPSLGGYGPEAAVNGNSMHPNADVRWGENYIADIYNCLRNSRYWDNLLFIVTFDENGGIYDHVTPPATVNPGDGYDYPPKAPGAEVLFDFTLLGPRVPAILISPWVDRGAIDSSQYQNTSILRFVQDLIQDLTTSSETLSLTERDKHAPSFARAFKRDTPRDDCPPSIEGYGSVFNWPAGYLSGATDTTPIVVTLVNSNPVNGPYPGSVAPPAGSLVVISGVEGNTAANGVWIVASVPGSSNEFELVTLMGNSTGNGAYVPNTGTWAWAEPWPWFASAGDDNRPPAPHVVDLAKQYVSILPGHPDSGKVITRTFPTKAALGEYTQERYRAAREHYARTRAKQKA